MKSLLSIVIVICCIVICYLLFVWNFIKTQWWESCNLCISPLFPFSSWKAQRFVQPPLPSEKSASMRFISKQKDDIQIVSCVKDGLISRSIVVSLTFRRDFVDICTNSFNWLRIDTFCLNSIKRSLLKAWERKQNHINHTITKQGRNNSPANCLSSFSCKRFSFFCNSSYNNSS